MNYNPITEFRDLGDTFTIEEVNEILQSKREELTTLYDQEFRDLDAEIEEIDEFKDEVKTADHFIRESYINDYLIEAFIDYEGVTDYARTYLNEEKIIEDCIADYSQVEFKGETIYFQG